MCQRVYVCMDMWILSNMCPVSIMVNLLSLVSVYLHIFLSLYVYIYICMLFTIYLSLSLWSFSILSLLTVDIRIKCQIKQRDYICMTSYTRIHSRTHLHVNVCCVCVCVCYFANGYTSIFHNITLQTYNSELITDIGTWRLCKFMLNPAVMLNDYGQNAIVL